MFSAGVNKELAWGAVGKKLQLLSGKGERQEKAEIITGLLKDMQRYDAS